MKCPRCGRQMIAHLTTPTHRCESCKTTYAADEAVKEAGERMMKRHRKSLEKLAR